MARRRSHRDGCGGSLHHSAAVLLLFLAVSSEQAGSEEEDGALPNTTGRSERLHATDEIRTSQRKHGNVKDGCCI